MCFGNFRRLVWYFIAINKSVIHWMFVTEHVLTGQSNAQNCKKNLDLHLREITPIHRLSYEKTNMKLAQLFIAFPKK